MRYGDNIYILARVVTLIGICIGIGILFGLVVPYLGDSTAILSERDHCSCSCYDEIVDMGYQGGSKQYRHIYINSTQESLAIICVALFLIIFLYESLSSCVSALFSSKKIDILPFCVFLGTLMPVCYGLWCTMNYFSKSMYHVIVRQLLFTFSEMVVSLLSLSAAINQGESHRDGVRGSLPRPVVWQIVALGTVCFSHLIVQIVDQGVEALFFDPQGFLGYSLKRVLRDAFFLVGDILAACLYVREVSRIARSPRLTPYLRRVIWYSILSSTFCIITCIFFVNGFNRVFQLTQGE
jgi:hypothetical protein